MLNSRFVGVTAGLGTCRTLSWMGSRNAARHSYRGGDRRDDKSRHQAEQQGSDRGHCRTIGQCAPTWQRFDSCERRAAGPRDGGSVRPAHREILRLLLTTVRWSAIHWTGGPVGRTRLRTVSARPIPSRSATRPITSPVRGPRRNYSTAEAFFSLDWNVLFGDAFRDSFHAHTVVSIGVTPPSATHRRGCSAADGLIRQPRDHEKSQTKPE